MWVVCPRLTLPCKWAPPRRPWKSAANALLVDVTQSKVAVDVDKEVIDNIPKGRSFQSLITFAPGARMEPLQGGRNDKGNSFQVDGASDAENVYLVDGVNMTDAQSGGVGKNFQIDFIETVQIKSTGFEAKYGGALGGVVNAVPKRGSNRVARGSADLPADEQFECHRPLLERNDRGV